ncbi:DEAD-box ATP-dependent RNA helicase 21-like [Forsythia ovata]|uniref:DEAD-box ATP-dependent RNA helicase 21-like n=1 Tax=Forsythia ovata TaxID=205694 RepID=A0ABD1UFI2_9LAMI
MGAKKPVFLTKAQREELALQRRQVEIAQQKCKAKLFLQSNNDSKPQRDRDRDRDLDSLSSRDHDRGRERDRDMEVRNIEKEREEEQKARERARLEKLAEREREVELAAVKEQILMKLGYFFGRGLRAGMDRREQKKLAAKNEKEIREEVRKKEGVEETRGSCCSDEKG